MLCRNCLALRLVTAYEGLPKWFRSNGTIWNSCLWQKHRMQKNECCIFLRSIFLPIQLVWVCMEASGTESLRARDMSAVLEIFFLALENTLSSGDTGIALSTTGKGEKTKTILVQSIWG